MRSLNIPFECGDIVTFAGKLEQNEYGIAELTTYGTDANKANIIKTAILIVPLILFIGGIF